MRSRLVGEATIPGEPQPKQRPRCAPLRSGKVRMFTPPATETAERAFAEHYKQQNQGRLRCGEDGLIVYLEFFSGYSRARRPDRMPDLDNLVKLLDALNGIAWVDDKQIDQIRARVRRGALEPRTEIRVVSFAPEQARLIDETTEMSAEQFLVNRHKLMRRARKDV